MNKQITFAALMAVLMSFVCPMRGWAQEVTIDDVRYFFKNGEATVTGCDKGKQGKLVIPASVSYENVEYSVTAIEGWAFSDCSGLTSIAIPASVTYIPPKPIMGCSSLTTIDVSSDNLSFSSLDGVLYNKDKSELLICPEGKKSVIIPESVTTIGSWAFEGCSALTSITLPEGVTTIGISAFSGCSALTSIAIPASVTEIMWTVFSDCSSLTTIDVSSDNLNYSSLDGVLYNKNKSELLTCPGGKKSVIIPKSVTSIGSSAFNGCAGLTSIVIPEGVTSIGEYAFGGCTGLTSIVIEGVTTIGMGAFAVCSGLTSIVIPEGVTEIGWYFFSNCTGLTSITLPGSLTSIEMGAFYGCSSLTTIDVSSDNLNFSSLDGVLYNKDKSELVICPKGKESVIIPEGVTTIGNSAFYACTGLTSIALPEGVTSIGRSAFMDCSGLTSIALPESVTSIGESAFDACSGLTSIVIPEGVTSIGDRAFDGCSSLTTIDVSSDNLSFSSLDGVLYNKDKSELLTCPGVKKSVIIPESVTTIGNSAFYACSGLTSIALPEGVTSIGDRAFYACSGLTSIALPEGVTSIGESAFYACSGLTSIVIPEGVTSIGRNAFISCSSLKTIYSKPVEPPYINRSVLGFLENSSDAVAYVPVGSKAAYEAAKGWNELTIEEFDFADVASSSIAPSFTAYATSGGVVLSAVEGEAEVAVYNLQGVALYRGTVSAGETVVALPSGSYVVRAGNGKGELVMVP